MAFAQPDQTIVDDWSEPPTGTWEDYAETPAYDVEQAYRQAQWDDPARGGSGTDFETFVTMQDSPDWGRREADEIVAEQYPEIAPVLGNIEEGGFSGREQRDVFADLAYLPSSAFEGVDPVGTTRLRDDDENSRGGVYLPAGYAGSSAVVESGPRQGVLGHELLHHADLAREEPWSSDPAFLDMLANVPAEEMASYAAGWGDYYGQDFDQLVGREVIANEGQWFAYGKPPATPEIGEYLATNVFGSRPGENNPYLSGARMHGWYEQYQDYDRRVAEMLAKGR